MAITSEIIGKLGGGAGAEETPVEGTASGSTSSETVFHTVEVPEGETWLVAAHGTLRSDTEGTRSAQLIVGTTRLPLKTPDGITSLVHVGTGTIEVKLKRNTGYGFDKFTGHVYTAKM